MRIFVITICSLALATGAYSAQPEENQQQKKKQPQTVHHAPAATAHIRQDIRQDIRRVLEPTQSTLQWKRITGSRVLTTGKRLIRVHPSTEVYHGQQGTYYGQKGKKGQTSVEAYHGQKGKKGQTPMGAYRRTNR